MTTAVTATVLKTTAQKATAFRDIVRRSISAFGSSENLSYSPIVTDA